ncbi:TPA: PAS domain-containing protein [Streptococcus agalactiae]
MKFVGIVGSNAEQSYNRMLLEFIRKNFKTKFELEVLEIDDIPMLGKRVREQVGNRMATVHGSLPPARMKNVEWVIGTLRNGNQEYVRTVVPGTPPEVINTHNYQAMYYPDGSYAGINEIIFNFKPWLDWYLQTTGQRLVGGTTAAPGASAVDATSSASTSTEDAPVDQATDATSGASEH